MNMMRNIFGGGPPLGNGGGPFANIAALLQKFNRFRKNPLGELLGINVDIPQNLNGNPEGMVKYLRDSGQMPPEQFNQLSQMANTFQQFLNK